MAPQSSFTARRPNASNLPTFELPPPQLSGFAKSSTFGGPPYSAHSGSVQSPNNLASVGNLLTPPTASTDGQHAMHTTNGMLGFTTVIPPYTPGGYVWGSNTAATSQLSWLPAMSPSAFSSAKSPLSPVSITNTSNSSQSPISNDGASIYPNNSASILSLPNPMIQNQHHHYMSNQGPLTTPISQISDPLSRSQSSMSGLYTVSSVSTPLHSPFGFPSAPLMQTSPMYIDINGPKTTPSFMSNSLGQLSSQSAYTSNRQFPFPFPGPMNLNPQQNQSTLHQQMNFGPLSPGLTSGYGNSQTSHMSPFYGQCGPNATMLADRPFKCDVCIQSFIRNHDLKRHKRIHLAVKPFPCGFCDKSFSRKDALKVNYASISYTHWINTNLSQRHILVKGCGSSVKVNRAMSEDAMDTKSDIEEDLEEDDESRKIQMASLPTPE